MEFQPKNLWEAVDHFLENITPGSANVLNESTEKEFLAITHHTNGMAIRNGWYLWWSEDIRDRSFKSKPDLYPQEKPAIVQFFNDLEITHADDMSGIILTTIYRKFHGLPVDLMGQVQKYKDYWNKYKSGRDPFVKKGDLEWVDESKAAVVFVDKHEGAIAVAQPSRSVYWQVYELVKGADKCNAISDTECKHITDQIIKLLDPKRVDLKYSTPEQLNQFRYDKEV